MVMRLNQATGQWEDDGTSSTPNAPGDFSGGNSGLAAGVSNAYSPTPGDLSGGKFVDNEGNLRSMPQGGGSAGGAQQGKSTATGLGALSEGMGLSSSYRPGGYVINRNAGYLGGDYGVSQQNQNYLGGIAAQDRAGEGAYRDQYNGLMGQGMQARGIQQQAADSYMNTLRGGSSLAQTQLAQGLQQSQAAQMSAAAGARGGGANLAAAQLGGANMMAQQSGAYNQQAAQLRAQEVSQAQAGLAGVGGQMRQQDYSGAGMGLQGINMQQQDAQSYEALRQRQQLGELAAQTDLEKAQAQAALQQQSEMNKAENNTAGGGSTVLGMVLGGLSDERTKTDKRDAGKEIDARLKRLRAMTYRYKDEPRGTERIGIMAQDMPPETIAEVGGLKVVRMPEAAGFQLAGMARIDERLRAIEEGVKKWKETA